MTSLAALGLGLLATVFDSSSLVAAEVIRAGDRVSQANAVTEEGDVAEGADPLMGREVRRHNENVSFHDSSGDRDDGMCECAATHRASRHVIRNPMEYPRRSKCGRHKPIALGDIAKRPAQHAPGQGSW